MNIRQFAWQETRGFKSAFWLAAITIGLVLFCLVIAFAPLEKSLQNNPALDTLLGLVFLLIRMVFNTGLLNLALAKLDDQTPLKIKLIFHPFSKILPLALVFVIQGLIFVILSIATGLFILPLVHPTNVGLEVISVIGTVVFFLLTMVYFYCFSFSMLGVYQASLDPFRAIGRSWHTGLKYFWSILKNALVVVGLVVLSYLIPGALFLSAKFLLVTQTTQSLLALAGLIGLLIPMIAGIWLLPFFVLLTAKMYREFYENSLPGDQPLS